MREINTARDASASMYGLTVWLLRIRTQPEDCIDETPHPRNQALLGVTVAIGALGITPQPGHAAPYLQTNPVSDIAGLATLTDPELRNSWGMSESATSPFWVSNQAPNTSTLYTVTNGTNVTKVNINPPNGFVGIPTTADGPQGPTGQVSNSNASSFNVGNGGNGGAAHFIFANLNGTISA